MQRFLFVLIASSLAALAPLRTSAEELFTGPNPNWVEVLDIPAATPALAEAAANGVLFLLSDEQVQWTDDEKQTYTRVATQVTDRIGLESAATLQFVYAPDYESLTLTRVAITRGTEIIDVTETVQADILRRETRLEEGILDGNLTALVQVPDLRVGDVIDYSYIRRTLPLVDGANRSGKAVMEFDVPVVLSRVVVNWPQDWPIYISGWPSRVAFTQTPGDGTLRHVWTRNDHIPTPVEEAAPAGYTENVIIEYSAFPDWSGVAAALSPHYLDSYPLGPEWDAKLRAIQAEHALDGDRVIAALRAVQDDLRYVSLSIGAGGLIARTPEEVTLSGYGDCKDKALLLRSMLDKMGIEAYVALTDLDEGHSLPDREPSIWSFDHAIVKVVVDGSTYWMDPTASHEGGDLFSAVTPDFGFALPLSGPDQQQLEPIFVSYNSTWTTNVDESYRFGLLGAYLTVTTSHFGTAANAYRQRLGSAPRSQISSDYLDYYAGRYPGLRLLAPLDVADDRLYNQITVTERYLIPITAITGRLQENFEFVAEDYAAYLPDAAAEPRSADLDMGEMRTHYHRVAVTNAPIDFNLPDPVSVYNDGFSYSFSGYAPAAGEVVLEWSYTQNLRFVPAAAADQVLRDADVVGENSWFAWDLRP
jgi:transglutaminase-like putative cysteine protease